MLQFIVYGSIIIAFIVVAIAYLRSGPTNITTVPGLAASDENEGNAPDIQKAGSLHQFLMRLHKGHGDIASFWYGQQLVVSIASPKLFKEHAKVFDRPIGQYVGAALEEHSARGTHRTVGGNGCGLHQSHAPMLIRQVLQ